MELAYRLAVSEQPFIKTIRSNLVVLINPVSEPDGRDRFVDWFYRYLKGKTDYESLPPISPPYWGKLRLPRQQPRRPPARPGNDAGGAEDLPRVPPGGAPRPARVDPAAPDLERNRPLEPEPGPDCRQRVLRHVLRRGARPDGGGHARRVDVGLRRRVRPSLHRVGGDQPQRHRARLRDVRQRERRDDGEEPQGPEVHGAAGHGERVVPARCRRRATSRGRCATTRTTCRRPASRC